MKRLLYLIISVLFFCILLAQEKPKEVELSEVQSAKLELAFLRAQNAAKDLNILQAQFEAKQRELRDLERAWKELFDMICKENKVDAARSEMTRDFKKLIEKPEPKP